MVTALIRYLAIMKRFFLLIAGTILGVTTSLRADDGRSVSMIVTKSGKTYQNCRIYKQDPDGVMFSHQNGAAKVLFADMTETMRNTLGYDAAKAEAYAKSVAERYQKERDRQNEYRNLLVKAQIAAAELEMKRLDVYGDTSVGMNGGTWNSGTLDYTSIAPYGYYYGFGAGAFNRLGGQHNRQYGNRTARGVFQNGPLCESTNGNFISVRGNGYRPSCDTVAKPPLGVPAISGFAPPMAVRAIPASGGR